MLPFNELPASLRIPGVYIEIDNTLAAQAEQQRAAVKQRCRMLRVLPEKLVIAGECRAGLADLLQHNGHVQQQGCIAGCQQQSFPIHL